MSTKHTAQIRDEQTIHPSAVIAPSAEIGHGCVIHPYAVIGPNTELGENCIVYPFAHIGSAPQVRAPDSGGGKLMIGANNRFFEGCTVSRGHSKAEGVTQIGDGNLFMAYSHIGHDCVIGNHTTVANHSSLAGHVHLQDHANIGGYVGIHQFVRIGCYSFVAANAMVSQDVPPFAIAVGDRARLAGLNRKGLARASFQTDEQLEIRRAFRTRFGIANASKDDPKSDWVLRFDTFVKESVRGVLKRHSEVDQADLS